MNYPYKSNLMKFTLPIALLILLTSCDKENDQQTIENSLIPGLVLQGEELAPKNIIDRMSELKVPGASVTVVRNGEIEWTGTYGWADFNQKIPVETTTLFQAASISKPITGIGVLKLVEEGKLDLDTDVNTYLTSWKVPENEFTQEEKVTLRRLLTHTAGINVHGFSGYETSPGLSTADVLNGLGNSDTVEVIREPGSEWAYSGGGYVIIQQVIEDVTGESFDSYMNREILPALHMTNSTFTQPLPADLHKSASLAYHSDMRVNPEGWNTYPSMAPAGLWTTSEDLAHYFIEVHEIYTSRKTDGVLSPESIDAMLTSHLGEWGLGPALEDEGENIQMQHGGKNMGFSNVFFSLPRKGDAAIILTNGDNGVALFREVLRAASIHYDWGVSSVDTVVPFEHPDDFYPSILGTYVYDPGEGNEPFVAKVQRNGPYLEMINAEGEVEESLIAESDSVFIDLSDGDVLKFSAFGDSASFTWNGYFVFERVISR